MKHTTLSAIAARVGASAIGGYGAAIGRDLWRSTKKGASYIVLIALLLAAVGLPVLGGRNLTRGYPGQAGFHWLVATLMIGIGYGLVLAAVTYAQGGVLDAPQYLTTLTVTASATAIGLAWGWLQRPRRKRLHEVEQHNHRILGALGFTETGEEEVTHLDGDGVPLRLMEVTEEALVFMAVGRRNMRAYLGLGPHGRIVGYSGVIKLGEQRIYRSPIPQRGRTAHD